jgi:two-component sensor histidine kinase
VATPSANDTIRPSRPEAADAAVLPRELDHRVANSLQLAADFLILRQVRIKDPFARAALIDAAERLVAVGHLHRFLSRHEGTALVDLRRFMEELAAIVAQSTGLRCRTDVEPADVPAELAQQIGLAVNELAINAAKHAYGRGEAGEVTIRAALDDEARLRVTVSDHGRGLGAHFDVEAEGGGLGLSIVRAIAAQLGARLEAEDDHGAKFTLLVPLARRAAGEQRTFWDG